MTTAKPYRLILGDCIESMREIESDSVDCVLADPPYCSGGHLEAQKNTKAQGLRTSTVTGSDFHWFASDNMSTSGLVWLLRSMMCEANRVLRPNRSAFVFTDWRMVPHLAPALESSGLRWRNMIVWDKANAGLGHGFRPRHEIILEYTNGSTEYRKNTGQNLIVFPRVSSTSKVHPAQKPVDLICQVLSVASPPGGTILDPFMGSGSTGVAAARLAMNFIGIERDPANFAMAESRLSDAYPTPTIVRDLYDESEHFDF